MSNLSMGTTLRDVAVCAGVSVSSASKILRATRSGFYVTRKGKRARVVKFSIKTARAVRAWARALGYKGGYLKRKARRERRRELRRAM